MKSISALIALAALSSAALANPPAPSGHPPMGVADMSKSTAPLTQTGKVASVLDAKQFTYIELKNGGKVRWVVSPAIAVKPGDTIHYANGQVMPKFHSKLLNRDFTDVLFTTHTVVGK
ncbi:hypothetical protein GALL_373500 [mine drainage metagenome]|uniref:Uncharacterized protein n=1 Tax=mine drainage metagenome TaxID=410659 RepID=A0A1J5QLS9_9ZZZZ